ncbi:hypothetical protein V8G61_13595 [Gaetbulibacter sp. M240]|uniref:hypothetical protein n=1 Tax=Gaetbulibacter sp. M240 TaxID=3126511 RepID=UPI00374E5724
MGKVLYFDNWDKGYRNFLRLDSEFKKNGFSTLMLHTSSLTNRDIQPEIEVCGLKVRDIMYYKTFRLKKIISIEKPSVIIILNLSFILDRAIVKICKDLNISIFYLAHGKLIALESVNKVKSVLGEKKLLSKINKKNLFSIYNYILGRKNPISIVTFLKNIIKHPLEFTTLPKYCPDLDVTKSFVYYQSDYELMTEEFGFPRDKVVVVGNPELDVFSNTPIINRKLFLEDLKIKASNYVAYIDDGLSFTHNWDMEKWMTFMMEINEIIKKNSLELVVKLHPRRNISGYESFFEEQNIKYFKDIDFKNYLFHSLFVLSHFSSVIVYALILNKKVKSPRWGLSKGLVRQYPEDVVEYFSHKEYFETSIFNIEVNKDLVKNYLYNSIGVVDGNSVDRIINEILKNVKS